MQEVNVNGHKILLYKNEDELPIKRYTKFQKYVVLESGVGSDINGIGEHFGNIFNFLTNNLTTEALQESKNLYYNFYVILEELNVPGMAFTCLLYSIDGELITDLSEDNCKALVNRLDEIGVTYGLVASIVEEVKKKIHDGLKFYAPDFFDDSSTIEFFANIKKKIKEIYNSINDGEDTSELKSINKYLAQFFKPQDFDNNSQENALLKIDREFENLCAILESNGVVNAASLTVLQFYLRLEYFKKVNSRNKNGNEVK